MRFLWEIKHLWILMSLLILGGFAAVSIRSELVPETYGDGQGRYGPYRAAALEQIAAQPSVYVSESVCHECHQDVEEERAGTLHESVACSHCHGIGREHVKLAWAAEESADATIPPAEEWDGDFLTEIDLYIARDRKTCTVCHEDVVGMPDWFQKINVADHLEEQGASEPEAADTCFECHGNHDTAP